MASKISERSLLMPISGTRKFIQYAKGLKDVIYLNIGEPDFPTPEYIREAAKKALDESFTHYTPVLGILELRQAIAEKLERENRIDVNPENEVLVTAGSQAAVFVAIQALVNPGDEVLMFNPGFPGHEAAIRLAGGTIVQIPVKEEDNFDIDPEIIESKITSRSKVLIINSPSNPTGSVTSKDRLEAVAEIARKYDLVIISDEIYEKIIYDEAKHYSMGSFPGMKKRVITINGFSKAYAMTGWRIGYVAADKILINEMMKLHHPTCVCANSIAQKAALAALQGLQDSIKEMVSKYDRRRMEIVRGLNKISGVNTLMPKGAFYVFPNVKSFSRSSEELTMYLIEKARVVTVPGSSFGDGGEGYLRISYAASIDRIKEAILRMKETLEKI